MLIALTLQLRAENEELRWQNKVQRDRIGSLEEVNYNLEGQLRFRRKRYPPRMHSNWNRTHPEPTEAPASKYQRTKTLKQLADDDQFGNFSPESDEFARLGNLQGNFNKPFKY